MIIFFPQLTIYHRVLSVVYLLHQVLFFLIQLFTLSLIFHFVCLWVTNWNLFQQVYILQECNIISCTSYLPFRAKVLVLSSFLDSTSTHLLFFLVHSFSSCIYLTNKLGITNTSYFWSYLPCLHSIDITNVNSHVATCLW